MVEEGVSCLMTENRSQTIQEAALIQCKIVFQKANEQEILPQPLPIFCLQTLAGMVGVSSDSTPMSLDGAALQYRL